MVQYLPLLFGIGNRNILIKEANKAKKNPIIDWIFFIYLYQLPDEPPPLEEPPPKPP